MARSRYGGEMKGRCVLDNMREIAKKAAKVSRARRA
jgi:hypothetical protein